MARLTSVEQPGGQDGIQDGVQDGGREKGQDRVQDGGQDGGQAWWHTGGQDGGLIACSDSVYCTLPVVGRTRHMYVNIYPSSIFDCVYIIPTESVKELSLTDNKTDLWVTAREAGLEPGRVGGWGKGRRPGWGPSRGPGRV